MQEEKEGKEEKDDDKVEKAEGVIVIHKQELLMTSNDNKEVQQQ